MSEQLQRIESKLAQIETKLDAFIETVEGMKQGFLEAIEEYEMHLSEEENNGKSS